MTERQNGQDWWKLKIFREPVIEKHFTSYQLLLLTTYYFYDESPQQISTHKKSY